MSRARELRLNQTEVEKRLWLYLRNRGLSGAKFRRQAPIGRFIVDFVCFEKHIVIELDGGQHAANATTDARRTAWLESQGFRVLRFWNNDVIENIEGVYLRIVEEVERSASLASTPHPPIASRRAPPSPTRGEGR